MGGVEGSSDIIRYLALARENRELLYVYINWWCSKFSVHQNYLEILLNVNPQTFPRGSDLVGLV